MYSTMTTIATLLTESTGVWLLLSLRQVCEHRANWQLKHLASSLLSKSSECWGEHGFTNHPFRNRDRNWQVGRAVVSGVKITLKCGAQWEAEWVSLWMVKAMGVTVYYVHMGNQTSVFWRWVNTFVLRKMKIFDVNLNSEWPQVLPHTKCNAYQETVPAHAQVNRLHSQWCNTSLYFVVVKRKSLCD